MTLSAENRHALVVHSIQKARKTANTVRFLLENDELLLAVNRIYYGIYYALSALALKESFQTSKHGQLIGWFNKTFIASGDVEPEIGKMIRKAFEKRMEGDYNLFAEFEKEEVEKAFHEMEKIIDRLESLATEK